MRSMFSMLTPRQATPAIMSTMPSVTTTFANNPNCDRILANPVPTRMRFSLRVDPLWHGTAIAAICAPPFSRRRN